MATQSDAAAIHQAIAIAAAVAPFESALDADLRHKALEAAAEELSTRLVAAGAAKLALHDAVIAKNAARKELSIRIGRVQAGAKARFGAESSEFASLGGKRPSERKRPVRKPKAKKDTPSGSAPNAPPA